MKSTRRIQLMVCLAPLLATLTDSNSALAEETNVPSDFKVVAEYGAGYSTWKSWKATIGNDGKVAQEIYTFSKGEKVERKNYALSNKDLVTLWTKINESSFPSLHEEYSYLVTDDATLILTITMNGKTHSVSVY